ncbi:hypothetical protein SAMN05216464_11490 [Mucilaginibacter pineti]|uniref:Uncharacterized protein n=1 Tax=Mucilaginibacter pineti TaxID=1391627 RepID=A0A1G7J7Y6_9SPHI|nr:hypothetical protein SAMN05216464_11490 [Mucilaginibacter pineti]
MLSFRYEERVRNLMRYAIGALHSVEGFSFAPRFYPPGLSRNDKLFIKSVFPAVGRNQVTAGNINYRKKPLHPLSSEAEERGGQRSVAGVSCSPGAYPPYSGSCWLRQWKLPNPHIISVESMPTTSRSGKHCWMICSALSSFFER